MNIETSLEHIKMRFSTLSTFVLLPLLALAEDSSTTTITSTQTLTKTITVSEVTASVYSTYALNSTTSAFSPTASSGKPAAATTTSLPANYMGAASSLNGMYAGSAGILVMIAAALL